MARVRTWLAASAMVVALLPIAPVAAAAPHVSPQITPISMAEARQRPVLRPGDRGVWVRRLHRALSISPARQPFAAATRRAVIAFRTAQGLRPRPVVNARTWRALGTLVVISKPVVTPGGPATSPSPSPATDRPDLSYGDTSGWVQAVQVALGVSPASGYFGPLTLAAVKKFQSESGLAVTGVVDAATWQALGSLVVAPQIDITTSEAARTSRAHRASIGVGQFANSWTARMVVQRESGGQCDISSPGGTYRGKWQMNAEFWSHYGGTEFAARADQATCEQQDLIAYRGWVDRWWQPWPTAIP